MKQKFELGLFEAPFVDPVLAREYTHRNDIAELAALTQQRSVVLLENADNLLPLRVEGQTVWLHGIDTGAAERAGFAVTTNLDAADLAIIRAETPFEILHPDYVFGAMQHEGNLAFTEDNEDYQAVVKASASVPVVLSVYMDRPAILTSVQDHVTALTANFGITDEALLAVLTGKQQPAGKLPFELPSAMAEVEAQFPDVPYDTANPLYPFGFGLEYQYQEQEQ